VPIILVIGWVLVLMGGRIILYSRLLRFGIMQVWGNGISINLIAGFIRLGI
jgi:hypothetical protein